MFPINQMTDSQLVQCINSLGRDIMSTSSEDYEFDKLTAQFDAVQEELEERGKWSYE